MFYPGKYGGIEKRDVRRRENPNTSQLDSRLVLMKSLGKIVEARPRAKRIKPVRAKIYLWED